MDLSFNWQVVKPHIRATQIDSEDTEHAPASETGSQLVPMERTLDADSPFSMDPAEGFLPANGHLDFTLTFAPPLVGSKVQ